MMEIYAFISTWIMCFFFFFSLFGELLQIVNGPEVLSKYVGETEKNVRDLFADAENDQKTRGKRDIPTSFISNLVF